jgi:hypothetical protein
MMEGFKLHKDSDFPGGSKHDNEDNENQEGEAQGIENAIARDNIPEALKLIKSASLTGPEIEAAVLTGIRRAFTAIRLKAVERFLIAHPIDSAKIATVAGEALPAMLQKERFKDARKLAEEYALTPEVQEKSTLLAMKELFDKDKPDTAWELLKSFPEVSLDKVAELVTQKVESEKEWTPDTFKKIERLFRFFPDNLTKEKLPQLQAKIQPGFRGLLKKGEITLAEKAATSFSLDEELLTSEETQKAAALGVTNIFVKNPDRLAFTDRLIAIAKLPIEKVQEISGKAIFTWLRDDPANAGYNFEKARTLMKRYPPAAETLMSEEMQSAFLSRLEGVIKQFKQSKSQIIKYAEEFQVPMEKIQPFLDAIDNEKKS